MRPAIKIITPTKQSHVGLWLRIIVESNWVLCAYQHHSTKQLIKDEAECFDTSGMRASNWRHLVDFSFEQFQLGVWTKDSRLAHALILISGNPVLG